MPWSSSAPAVYGVGDDGALRREPGSHGRSRQRQQTQQQQRDAAQHHAAMLQPAEDVQASLSALEGLLGLDPKPALPGYA
jgi:hypothetical protein